MGYSPYTLSLKKGAGGNVPFLCEGSEGKAEYAFINFVIDEFWSGEKYTLISADGNKNIKICFYEILDSFQIGDTFILFLIV